MKVKTVIEILSKYDENDDLIIDWVDKEIMDIYTDEAWKEICDYCYEVDFGLDNDWLSEIIRDIVDRLKGKGVA
jgi:hypothetical protein